MKIFAFQNSIKDALNGIEALVQGGCKAFAEDTRTVYDESAQWMSEGKVAIVVVTPKFTRNGWRADAIPCDTRLMVRCMELPPIADEGGTLRALDAAELVGLALDAPNLQFEDIDQTISTNRDGNTVVTATATFNTTIHLTND